LPESLRALQIPLESAYTALRVNHNDEIEPILACLRQSGCVVDELQLQQADLEDVFLQIMDGTHQ